MIDRDHYTGLQHLHTFPFPVYTSLNLTPSASGIATRYERTYRFLSATLGVAPQLGLVILDAADWPRYAALPTYGITHYDHPHRMVVTAAGSSTFWQPAIDLIRMDDASLLQDLHAVYGQPDGSIDLAAHIELWITHDLGHAFHLHIPYWFPRRWLLEYFADLCSYTYVAINEPDRLPTLETFPRVLGAIDARHLRYCSLHDFEAHCDVGDWTTENYPWYHGCLYEAAKQSYRAAGVRALQRLWQTFVLANLQEVPAPNWLGYSRMYSPSSHRSWAHGRNRTNTLLCALQHMTCSPMVQCAAACCVEERRWACPYCT